jgi:hypothetical protein
MGRFPDWQSASEEELCLVEVFSGCGTYHDSFRLLCVNPLNAELNPICHLLVLLGDLTFMGPCIVSIFQYKCISNKMQRYTIYLYLKTALHVSDGASIIRSAYKCIYSIWYLTHRYCYLPLSWKSWNWFECAVGGVLYNVASCWIYIGILLGGHPILHISKIRINKKLK